MIEDTIAAPATAPGRGALSVVRVSGRDAIGACDAIYRGKRRLHDLSGGTAAVGWIVAGGEEIDQAVVTVFRAPKSYTGENLVEISCHGGAAAGYVLEALAGRGVRPARPGEFTQRAFLNGRIDLSQAEAVAALVAARGRAAHRAALRLLKGHLREEVEPIYAAVLSLHARLEAHIEFPEDLEENNDPRVREGYIASDETAPRPSEGTPAPEEVASAAAAVRTVLGRAARSDLLRGGLRCVLTGPVNVGKSSLFNGLLSRNRAIVTEEPGTTRDVLEGTLEFEGVPVTLVDTAGLREPATRSEAEGTKRSAREREDADVILEVRDASRPVPADDPLLGGVPPGPGGGVRIVPVLNKTDLGIHPSWGRLDPGLPSEPAGAGGSAEWARRPPEAEAPHPGTRGGKRSAAAVAPPNAPSISPSRVSAVTGHGLDALRRRLAAFLEEAPGNEILLNLRQRGALESAAGRLDEAATTLREGGLPEVVSFEVGDAARELGAILGRDAGDELLDEIFSNFCIGK